ncbi:MAG: hypothetical protein H7296_16210 [Bacteroidia bacterium]|nr:hypothetical protein [Bacteroidia bacterium]
MKNLILFFCLCALTVWSKKIHAQAFCEFDSGYFYLQERGFKIIETKSKHFLAASINGYANNLLQDNHQSLRLSKLDKCGKVLWSSAPDTILPKETFALISGIIEESNGDIMYAARYAGPGSPSLNGIRLIKTDSNGNVKWRNRIGDSVINYNMNEFIKLNANAFLFTGNFDSSSTKHYFCILVADTLGNILLRKTTLINSNLTYNIHAYKQPNLDMFIVTLDDSTITFMILDTVGLIKKTIHIFKNRSYGIFSATLNANQSEIIINGSVTTNEYLYVARYSLTGLFIKDTVLTNIIFNRADCINFDRNANLFHNSKNWILTDSAFNIQWVSSLKKDPAPFLNIIKSSDNSFVGITSYGNTAGSTSYYGVNIKKRSISNLVKSISINGPVLLIKMEVSFNLSQQFCLLTQTIQLLPGALTIRV